MEIVIKPSLSIEDAYNALQKMSKEHDCVCWCDFNGVKMFSSEPLDVFFMKLRAEQEYQQGLRPSLTLNGYQQKAMTTCLPSCDNTMYMLLGLTEEVGELNGKISKAIRKGQINVHYNNAVVNDDKFTDEIKEQIKSECSDILWMLAGLVRQFHWSLEEVAQYNLDKLAKRKESGTIVTHTDH